MDTGGPLKTKGTRSKKSLKEMPPPRKGRNVNQSVRQSQQSLKGVKADDV